MFLSSFVSGRAWRAPGGLCLGCSVRVLRAAPTTTSSSARRRERRQRRADRVLVHLGGVALRLAQHHSAGGPMAFNPYDKLAKNLRDGKGPSAAVNDGKGKGGGKGGGGKGKAQPGKAGAVPGLPPPRPARRQRSTADWVCALCRDADGSVFHINPGTEQWCTRCLLHKGTDHAFGGRVCDQVRKLEEREFDGAKCAARLRS